MLGAQKATDSNALALRRLVRGKPRGGYIELEKRKTVHHAVREMNVRVCSHQEPLVVTMPRRKLCEDDFFSNSVCERSC